MTAATHAAGPRAPKVLVVDDNAQLRRLMVRALGRAGYDVLEAACAESALEVAARTPEALRVLVTDVGLPGMAGPELAAHLTSAHAGLRVLYTSGLGAPPGQPFLAKPFAPDELLRCVRSMLRADES